MQYSRSKYRVALQRFAKESMQLKRKNTSPDIAQTQQSRQGQVAWTGFVGEAVHWPHLTHLLSSHHEVAGCRTYVGVIEKWAWFSALVLLGADLGSVLWRTIKIIKAALTENAKSKSAKSEVSTRAGFVGWYHLPQGRPRSSNWCETCRSWQCDARVHRVHRVQTHSPRPRRPGLVLGANDNAPGTRCMRYVRKGIQQEQFLESGEKQCSAANVLMTSLLLHSMLLSMLL